VGVREQLARVVAHRTRGESIDQGFESIHRRILRSAPGRELQVSRGFLSPYSPV
jgi:hypothetical protein